MATLGGALDALEGSRRPRRHAGARPPSRHAFSVRTIRRRGSHSPISIIGYPLQGKELAGSSGVVASGVVPALALDGASVPSTAPPTESDSMAGRIAAQRRARRKQFAPSRPLGAPTVSMLESWTHSRSSRRKTKRRAKRPSRTSGGKTLGASRRWRYHTVFYYLNDRVIFELHTSPLTLGRRPRPRAGRRRASREPPRGELGRRNFISLSCECAISVQS